MASKKASSQIKFAIESLNGFVPFLKPKNVHTDEIANWFRRELEKEFNIIFKKVNLEIKIFNGLEPFASGVSLVAIGNLHRFLRYQKYLPMQYSVIAELGLSYDSFAVQGKLQSRKSFEHVDEKILQQLCTELREQQELLLDIPKFYQHNAEKDEEPKSEKNRFKKNLFEKKVLASRNCSLINLDLIDFRPPYFCLHVIGSNNLQIRSLIDYMGKKLGTYASVIDIHRSSIHNFKEKDCLEKEDIYWKYIKPKLNKCTPIFMQEIHKYIEDDPLKCNYRIR